MVTQQEWTEIKELIGTGLSVPQISRELERSTTTIYRLMRLNGPRTSSARQAKKHQEVVRYKEYLSALIKKGIKNIQKLHYELTCLGFQGSYASLYQYLKSNKAEFSKYKPSRHIETEPGEQAQVDWGHFGKIEVNGQMEKLYCFVYLLAYSRVIYIEFTIRQNLKTLQQCHIHALKKQGLPRTIVYDNMKTVVLKREKNPGSKPKIHYNPAFLDFANYYGFEVIACPPYWPRAKGKVEAAVKLVRNNFMQGMQFGRDFSTLEELNQKALLWLETFANVRKHATLDAKPIDKWEEEKAFLRFPKSLPNYDLSPFVVRNSTKDGLIQYKSNFYSVPMEFARRKLLLREVNESGVSKIKIYYEDKIIATHLVSSERGKWIVEDRHLIEKHSKPRKRKLKKATKDNKRDSIAFTRSLEYYEPQIPENN